MTPGRVRRTRRSVVGLAAVLALGLAVAAVSAAVPGGAGPHPGSPGEQAIRATNVALEVPDGMTLVGYRSVAVTVPEEWSRDAEHCGVPAGNTVVLPLGPVCAAGVSYPAEISSVEFHPSWGSYPEESAPPTTPVTLDGHEFTSTGVVCPDPAVDPAWSGWVVPCRTQLTSTTDEIAIVISSSLTPESAARAQIEELVAGVRSVGDASAAVPGMRDRWDVPRPEQGAAYAAALEAAGLVPRIEEVRTAPSPEGTLEGVSPVPGSVLARGTEVTVYVAAAPRNPAEQVSFSGRYSRPDNGTEISDADLRSGTSIEVELGDSIVVSGMKQPVEGTPEWDEYVADGFLDVYVGVAVGGTLDGSSIEVVENDRVAMWQAVGLGRTTLAVTYTEDGETYDVGTIEVDVVA